jgi:DNA-binding NtrC family response regulator
MAVVLVVEDDEQVRVLAESVLQETGYAVIAATGIEGATALLASDQPIDLMFIDINLGNDLEAGLRVAREAKELRPELRILYTTGAGINAGMKAMFVEPFLFLAKPYTVEQLTKSIEFLLLKSRSRPKLQLPDSPRPD